MSSSRDVFSILTGGGTWQSIRPQANFTFLSVDDMNLADVSYVHFFMMLASDKDGSFRKTLWLRDAEIASLADKAPANDIASILTGKSDTGFNLGILSALNYRKKPAPFLQIEDSVAGKTLLIGAEPVPKPITDRLAALNIEYLEHKHPEITRAAVNKFVADGLAARETPEWQADFTRKSLIRAFAFAVGEKIDPASHRTLGDVVSNEGTKPKRFVEIKRG